MRIPRRARRAASGVADWFCANFTTWIDFRTNPFTPMAIGVGAVIAFMAVAPNPHTFPQQLPVAEVVYITALAAVMVWSIVCGGYRFWRYVTN